ncbi:hypothetical protein LRP67_09250 [Nocardioides sp. cx-169]|uniref:hypothetical protein n=1 Tax=Nocardioides sp. cx-169 TaxID=2899080 RepID=UPI001E3CF8CD|nr:hypothetical protein [Nocardioides sp. cx-169]MCD4534265.1 hypothetical protein [Nocardioides sp. cx-169]
MTGDHDVLEAFLELSATLTGYSRFRLRGTGQAEPYLETTRDASGDGVLADLLATSTQVHAAAAGDEGVLDRGLRARILSDDRLGPVARNVIKMWFVGTWYQLPQEWRDAHATRAPDATHVVSPASYTEGLLWPTIGANPPGAKGQGYGTWSSPPRLDLP